MAELETKIPALGRAVAEAKDRSVIHSSDKALRKAKWVAYCTSDACLTLGERDWEDWRTERKYLSWKEL